MWYRITFFIVLVLFYFPINAQKIPEVPQSISIDNIVLSIEKEAQKTIQNEVDAIHANEKYFKVFIDRINIYFPIIEKILSNEGIPDDIKYLSIQESALIPNAISSSNAVGFWQFKAETGRDYDLVINDNIDERKNIVSSTKAACRYLKNSNYIFENWIFSILSYMQGLNGTKLIVEPKLYGAKRMVVDSETHWYVKKFLAHKIAFQDHINKNEYKTNYSIYENLEFSSIEELSNQFLVSKDEINSLNLWINSDKIPNDRIYSFLIPEKKENMLKKIKSSLSTKVKSFIDSNFKSSIDEKIIDVLSKRTLYLNNLPAIIIDSTDNIDNIIKLYSINRNDFFSFNDISSGHVLVLEVPYYFSKKKKRGKVEAYVRKEDEDLWKISQMFGIQLKSLVKFNKKNKSNKILLRKRVKF